MKNNYVSSFDKSKACEAHNGTILAADVLPVGVKAPFGHAWGYLEGKSMMEAHSHPTEEIYLVTGGKGHCHINGERFAVKPGDVIEIPPGAEHTMECADGSTLLWAAFWWDPID